MADFIAGIMEHLRNLNLENPAMFLIVFLAALAVFRRWGVLLLTLLVIVLGWGAQDLIIMNIQTDNRVVSLPLVIYSAGGVLVVLLSLWSFYKG